jgi:hypothetical protein
MITYDLSQLSHVSHESGHPKALVFHNRPTQLVALLTGFETEDQFNLSLRRDCFRGELQTDRDVCRLLFVTKYLHWGTPLGSGRLIVVCVLIQKRRQVYPGKILIGWKRSFLIDVEAGA